MNGFSLMSSAYGAFSDNSLYGFSSLQNPMCFSYSIQCLSDTIVVNMIMSLSDQQFCVSVARRQQYWILAFFGSVCIVDPTLTANNLVLIKI